MNNTQHQLILGSLLGDGGLTIHNNGKNAYFYESHCLKQREYSLFKYYFIKDLCKSEPKSSRYYSDKYQKWYESIRFRTKCSEEFTSLWHLWYKNGKKIIPLEEVAKLNAFGLSIWFSDDGSSTQSSRREIASHSFTVKENYALINILHNNFKILPEIAYQKGKPYLVFSKTSMRRLIEIIKPHIHLSMKYKIDKVSKKQRHFTAEEAIEIREKYDTGEYTQRSLAKEKGVSCATICKTLNGKYSTRDPYDWI